MLCSSPELAKGLLAYYIRSRFYFAAVREQSRILIDGLRNHVRGGTARGMPRSRRRLGSSPLTGHGSGQRLLGQGSMGGAQRDGPFAYWSHAGY